MADRKEYSAQVSEDSGFSELTVQRAQSDVDLARSHVAGRNRRVGQFLCYLSLMHSHGLVPPGTRCEASGAQLQDFNSEAGYQAAHYLPGQIILWVAGHGKLMPWELVQDRATRDRIGALFSRVQNLPANFNKADSYAEKYASPPLKDLFADSCRNVLGGRPPVAGAIHVAAVRKAYDRWIERSVLSYRSAINRKIDIADLDDLPPATAPGIGPNGALEPHLLNPQLADLLERAVRKGKNGRATTVWDYSEQTRILGHYLRFSQQSMLGDRLIQDIQSTFRP